jgi:ABC-type enterobactin transport system permease subunit
VVPYDPQDNLTYIFVHKLSLPFRQKLETARAAKVLNAGNKNALSWADVVAVAKDDKYSVKVVTE